MLGFQIIIIYGEGTFCVLLYGDKNYDDDSWLVTDDCVVLKILMMSAYSDVCCKYDW